MNPTLPEALTERPTTSRPGPKALLAGRRFVWLLSPPWDSVWTRQNHFTIRLAKLGAEILYVENPPAWSTLVRRAAGRGGEAGRGRLSREVEPGLHVMRPAAHLPGAKHSHLLGQVNGWLAGRRIARWLGRRGWLDYACWCRLPHSLFPLRHLQPLTTIYDITDDYEQHESSPRCRRLVREREAQLLRRADQVFVTSEELLAKPALRGRRACCIPNGVEYDLFAQASREGTVHPLLASMKKPVIGYVGLTSHWMDFDLLEMLGRRWPRQVLMLGPIALELERRARSIPGLVWGGFVPQPGLPAYLRGIDVCILPHLVNDLNRCANPLKIWEYLASGKPFVSVDLPALGPVRHLVDVARDRAHFLELVEERLADPRPERREAAQRFARSRSWDRLFEEVLRRLTSN